MSRKRPSILQDYEEEPYCYLCGSTELVEEHHIFGGVPGRRISEREGFKVLLCAKCHRNPRTGVHSDRQKADELRAAAQEKYEETHDHQDFMNIIGMNFI